MTKDIYAQIRKEIASLWKSIQASPHQPLSECKTAIHHKLSIVNSLASKVGGRVQQDAENLQRDVDRFLMGELSTAEIERMFQDALRLEQDTREL
jgi:hypothetical protein